MFKATVEFIQRYKQKKISLKNTFDTLRLVTFLSYITGLRVFEYPHGHPRPRLSFLYAILISSIYYIGWYYQKYMLKLSKDVHFHGTIHKITGIMNQVGIFVILIVGCYQTKSLKLSIRRIHEIDVTLRALGSPGNFNIIYKKMIGIVTFVFLQVSLYIALHISVHMLFDRNTYKTIILICSTFVHLYGQVVEYILIIEFLVIISCLNSEFQRVNDLLGDVNILPFSSIAMELLDSENSKDSCPINKSFIKTSSKLFTILPCSRRLRSHLQMTSHEIIRNRRLLQTIRQVHLELYRISKCISMIYGIQTAIEMGLCISYITYFIYSLYSVYDYYGSTWFVVIIVGTTLLCTNNSFKIFSINYICEKTSQQAQRTGEIIYTFYGQSADSELRNEVEMFCLQMMHCRVVYSAAGLYSLNYKAVCGSVGVIATYVIIMIQVANSIEKEIS